MLIHSKRLLAILALVSLAAVLAIATQILPAPTATGQVGVSYSYTFVPGFGVAPYTYSTSGQLPPGLTLNPNTGVLSGTPTAPGPYSFNVTVTDSFVQQGLALGTESLRHTKGMADGNVFGPYPFTITIAPGVAGAPMSPAALALLMLGLAAAGIFRMRHARQA